MNATEINDFLLNRPNTAAMRSLLRNEGATTAKGRPIQYANRVALEYAILDIYLERRGY